MIDTSDLQQPAKKTSGTYVNRVKCVRNRSGTMTSGEQNVLKKRITVDDNVQSLSNLVKFQLYNELTHSISFKSVYSIDIKQYQQILNKHICFSSPATKQLNITVVIL